MQAGSLTSLQPRNRVTSESQFIPGESSLSSAKRKISCAILALFLISAVGCSRVSKENYDKLKAGMAYEEVVNILGSPSSCSETLGTKSCVWGDEKRQIKVSFVASKAIAFSNKGL